MDSDKSDVSRDLACLFRLLDDGKVFGVVTEKLLSEACCNIRFFSSAYLTACDLTKLFLAIG